MSGDHWIVVGAGSAGCVVAARLSENPARHVTVLDAGPDLVPGAVPAEIDGDDFLAALGLPGRIHGEPVATRTTGAVLQPYMRGRGIGGSSAVNAMVGLRGDPAQYRSWGWNDVDAAWDRVAIPVAAPDEDELGTVDRALLAADPRAFVAPLTRRAGRRVTSAEAYLWPAAGRANLAVRPRAPVERIVLAGRRAIGVRLDDGTEIAADHVVVSAGAIESPALLLRSGIDTPGVGAHVQDHPAVPFTLHLAEPPGRGLVVGSLVHDHGIQLLPMNHLGGDPAVAGLGALMVALMTPVGRSGSVALGEDGRARVDFALLDDERDVAALAHGVRRALDVLRRTSFASIVDQIDIDEHGSTIEALSDDVAIASWVRSCRGEYVHASGSCAMGKVVDAGGAVHGYGSLSVCDASVFPSIPGVNTHLPTTMLAERLCARWT